MDAIEVAKVGMALKALSILLAEASEVLTLFDYGSEFYRGLAHLIDVLAEKLGHVKVEARN